jgi:hypothetical protein
MQVSDDVLLVAYYGKQHHVMISSGGVGRPISGSQWLDDGTLLRYNINEVKRTPGHGGEPQVFFRWTFNNSATDPAGTTQVSRPVVLAPEFTSLNDRSGAMEFQEDVIPWLMGALIVLVLCNSYVVAHGRKANRKPKIVAEA